MIDMDQQEKMIWFSRSFNEQMAWIDEEVKDIIKHDTRKRIQERGRDAYGEPGCASSVKRLFDIIKADPKNRPLMREICLAERELTEFLFDGPNALSEQEISAYWENYLTAYTAELQQSRSLYYLLVKGGSEVLGIYRRAGVLKTAYDKAVRELEKERKDSGTAEEITINSFDEASSVWQYNIDPDRLFGAKYVEKGKADVIIECVMDSPDMYKRKIMDTNRFKDVIIFSFAEPGAMGAGGIIGFFTDKGVFSRLDYLSEETPYGEIREAFPILKNCRFNGPMPNAARPENAPQEVVIYTDTDNMNIKTRVAEGWRHIYMGFGNHLVIREDHFEEFSAEISDLKEEVDIYGEWLCRARKLYGGSEKG